MTEENKIHTDNSETENIIEQNSQSDKITELQKKITDLETVINDLNDKLLRALAEGDNFRKRSKEDLEKANKYALSSFANDLVLVTENFHLAVDNMPLEAIEKCPEIKNFADAVIMTKKELTKVFEKNGIKRLMPIGEKFDHNFHEAISKIETDGEERLVVKVVQAGYLINDRLIRPALVTVSCLPSSNARDSSLKSI